MKDNRELKDPSNANVILDYTSIHQPVADVTALNAIPTGPLVVGDLCMVIADKTLRQWTGSAWILAGTYLIVADTAPRLALTSTQVNNGQLVSQLSDKSLWVAAVSGVTVTWNQIGGPGSYDPFDAIVDGVGTATNHYVNETAAIAAGKAVIFTVTGTTDSLNFKPPVIYFAESVGNLSNSYEFGLSHGTTILVANSKNRYVWDADLELWQEKIPENLENNDLKVGTLCCVAALKKYFYWNGVRWLSPEQAGDLHPFSKLTDENAIGITRNTIIYRGGATYHLSNQVGFDVPANLTLEIYSASYYNTSTSVVGATLLTGNAPGTNFFTGDGCVKLQGINFIQGGGSLFDPTLISFTEGCQSQAIGNNSNYFNLGANGSSIKNVQVISQAIGTNPANVVTVGPGCVGDNIYIDNSTASTGTHITNALGGKLTRVFGTAPSGSGGQSLVILNQGYFEGCDPVYPASPMITNDGGTIANTTLTTTSGFAPRTATLTNINTGCRINNVKLNNVTVLNDATAVNTVYLESTMTGGSYSDLGAGTLGFANTGGLPNTVVFKEVADATAREALTSTQVNNGQLVSQLSDKTVWFATVSGTTVTWSPIGSVPGVNISPYQATLDDIGTLPNHYENLGTSYPAGKTFVYDMVSIEETGDITYNPTDQIYFQIAQNSIHDLKTYSLIGSYAPVLKNEFDNITSDAVVGANALTIEFADASSRLSYGYTAATLPFANFDNQSTIVIDGKGGVIANSSTVANTYIECLGTLSIRTVEILLPNASAGGVKTHLYSTLAEVEFTGGGVNCDTALIADGGSTRDLIMDTTFKDNSTLISATNPTASDVTYTSVPTNNTIEVWGQASKVLCDSQKIGGFITVVPKNSSLLVAPEDYNYADMSSISQSIIDELSVPTGLINAKITNSIIGLLTLPSDNSTEIDFDHCTFINNFTFYGNSKFTGCRFLAGFDPQTGSEIGVSNSSSSTAVTFGGGVTKYRSANNANIGNDY